MNKFHIDWDPSKAESNLKKHGVSFEEAQTVFFDEFAIEFFDDEHSIWENRFLLLGTSLRLRLLIVCYCLRENESLIRIISARKATSNEARYYSEMM